MNIKNAKSLRNRLNTKIIRLVKPSNMSIDEYKIACNLNGFDASLDNGMFLHWIMTAEDSSEIDVQENVEEDVHRAIVNATQKGYLLDASNHAQCSYFCDAIADMVLKDKEYAASLLKAVLANYKNSSGALKDVFNFCKSLNRAFGLTREEYFNYDGLKSIVVNAQKDSKQDD